MGFWNWKKKKISNLPYRRRKTNHIQDNLPSSPRRNTVSALQVVSPRPKINVPTLFLPS